MAVIPGKLLYKELRNSKVVHVHQYSYINAFHLSQTKVCFLLQTVDYCPQKKTGTIYDGAWHTCYKQQTGYVAYTSASLRTSLDNGKQLPSRTIIWTFLSCSNKSCCGAPGMGEDRYLQHGLVIYFSQCCLRSWWVNCCIIPSVHEVVDNMNDVLQ